MLVYRLAREKYIRDLSGKGARIYGGRWNQKGTSILYTSEHCSLALLELLVHTSHNLLPEDICLLKLSISDEINISKLEIEDLPAHWKQFPAPYSLGILGTKWCTAGKTAILKVPSVVVPNEWNILLSPDHPQFSSCKIESVSKFQIDVRF